MKGYYISQISVRKAESLCVLWYKGFIIEISYHTVVEEAREES